MTCAAAARIGNKDFPGGEVLGKITAVELRIDSARRSTVLTLAAGIGTGQAPADPGDGREKISPIPYALRRLMPRSMSSVSRLRHLDS